MAILHKSKVLPQWVDYNGHMSEAFYVLIFGHATDAFYDHIGFDSDYRTKNFQSLYTVEAHVSYLREVREGESLKINTEVIGYDKKRIHLFHEMIHEKTGKTVAEEEILALHVSTEGTPQSKEFDEKIEKEIENCFSSRPEKDFSSKTGKRIKIK
jgi:acyl-CoA thioester hydrolase